MNVFPQKMLKTKLLQKYIDQLSKSSSGFTLTEVVVATIIISILTTGAVTALNNLLLARSRSQQRSQIASQLSRALDYINSDVRSGNRVWNEGNIPADANLYQDANCNNGGWDFTCYNIMNAPNSALYVRIPLRVESFDNTNDEVTVTGIIDNLSEGDFIVFREDPNDGSSTDDMANGSDNREIFLINGPVNFDNAAETTTFSIDGNLGDTFQNNPNNHNPNNYPGGNFEDTITANRLILYYTDNDPDENFLYNNVLRRAVGPCDGANNNCSFITDGLVDNDNNCVLPFDQNDDNDCGDDVDWNDVDGDDQFENFEVNIRNPQTADLALRAFSHPSNVELGLEDPNNEDRVQQNFIQQNITTFARSAN